MKIACRSPEGSYVLQMKESPWEGGVRGVAALWSPLLCSAQRVSNQLMHIADWLPTFYSAAGTVNHCKVNNFVRARACVCVRACVRVGRAHTISSYYLTWCQLQGLFNNELDGKMILFCNCVCSLLPFDVHLIYISTDILIYHEC
jgi:hypothetical protein